jgi:hypothetical protein
MPSHWWVPGFGRNPAPTGPRLNPRTSVRLPRRGNRKPSESAAPPHDVRDREFSSVRPTPRPRGARPRIPHGTALRRMRVEALQGFVPPLIAKRLRYGWRVTRIPSPREAAAGRKARVRLGAFATVTSPPRAVVARAGRIRDHAVRHFRKGYSVCAEVGGLTVLRAVPISSFAIRSTPVSRVLGALSETHRRAKRGATSRLTRHLGSRQFRCWPADSRHD